MVFKYTRNSVALSWLRPIKSSQKEHTVTGRIRTLLTVTTALLAVLPTLASADDLYIEAASQRGSKKASVQLGPRPFFLIDDMQDGPLKQKLQSCANGPFRSTNFSIGHRGAALQFPEHTRESYLAAARMGAGIIECDVTFTKDKELVCRHAQNDLHTTTNILTLPELATKCTKLFIPATFDASGKRLTTASAECRTSDITLAEFKTLHGKMDAFNPNARTPEEFQSGTVNWRTDLYSGPTSGTLMTHKESIALFKTLGVGMTPELKNPSVTMPFEGFTQARYAQKLIDEYKDAGVSPRQVWPQSFNKGDIEYWIAREPEFGKQAVYLDDAETLADLPTAPELAAYKAEGINIVAPPLFALLTAENGQIVPSQYAKDAKDARLDIITWTLERSGVLADGNNGFYYQTFDSVIRREGDMMTVLDVLAQEIGILGIFSDWPATVTYYASCMNLR
jgi:glycerophosphoryl diester phosphodiesterase